MSDKLRHLHLEAAVVEHWVAQGWIAPAKGGYSEADLARACLIRDLREAMGVNDEGVSVALGLLDQLHGMRRALRRVAEAMHTLPDPVRQEVLTVLRQSAEG